MVSGFLHFLWNSTAGQALGQPGLPLGNTVSIIYYRSLRDECVAWAASATTDKERAIFKQMAAAWQLVVELAEGDNERTEPWGAFAELCSQLRFCYSAKI
jgi:hypothetical protein